MKLRHLFFACYGVFVIMFSLLLLVVIVFSDEEDGGSSGNLIYGGVSVSQEVLAHKPMLEKYAREYGIEEYLNVLLAIIQVESGGTLEDVMQSSESLGLPPNSLSTEESIKQGCKYFSELLAAAETKGCDLNSVIQSYNYGGGFLDYVTGRGKKYTFELAESFARDKSGGKKVTYTNPVAVEKNGGWRYSYGNMFYVLLVSQYLTVAQFDDETVQAIIEEALKYEGWTYVYGGDSPSLPLTVRTGAVVLWQGRNRPATDSTGTVQCDAAHPPVRSKSRGFGLFPLHLQCWNLHHPCGAVCGK